MTERPSLRRSLGGMLLLLSACATVPARAPDGARVAIAFDGSRERGSWADGSADPATGRAVTPDDPVRIASVSKLAVAVGVMRLVEQGKLTLDADVSTYLGGPLRNPAFPDRPVTLRQLLSHTSSVRDHDDQYAIPLGGSLKAVLADPNSWDAQHGPGDGFFTYSNLNFPIVASVMEMATGERFDRLMKRLVIDPIGLAACFNWPTCSDERVARAVVLMQDGKPIRDDVHGKRPDCPVFVEQGACDLSRWRLGENGALFAPQGGLRISARDLARIGRMLLNGGTIDDKRILSPESIELLLRPAWTFDGTNGDTDDGFYCRYGLATEQLATRQAGCADDPEGKGREWVGHAGEAYGLRSGIWIDRRQGVGIAYFVTGLPDDPPRGRSAFTQAEEEMFERARMLSKH